MKEEERNAGFGGGHYYVDSDEEEPERKKSRVGEERTNWLLLFSDEYIAKVWLMALRPRSSILLALNNCVEGTHDFCWSARRSD